MNTDRWRELEIRRGLLDQAYYWSVENARLHGYLRHWDRAVMLRQYARIQVLMEGS